MEKVLFSLGMASDREFECDIETGYITREGCLSMSLNFGKQLATLPLRFKVLHFC